MARKRRATPGATVAPAPAASAVALNSSLPVEPFGVRLPALILALMMFLAPALGVPSELMLQDTLKSIIVSFAALAALVLLLWNVRDRVEPLRWHAVMWLPLLLLAYALGSMAWSHRYLAGVEAVRWFVFAVIAWLALNTLARERLHWLAAGMHAGAVVASVWAILQFLFAFDLFPQGPNPASTFINRNFFAEYVVCTLPFGAMLLARSRSTAAAGGLAVSLGLVVAAILMTGTRAALIALWLQLLLVLPLIAWRCRGALAFARWDRGLKLFAAGAFIATVVLLGMLPSHNAKIVQEERGATGIARALNRTQSIGPRDYSLGVRMIMWRATVNAIQARPLQGLGAGAWESEVPRYQAEGSQLETDYYVHNEYLQLVAEYGIVGWAFLALLAAYLLSAAWRSWRAADEEARQEQAWRAVLLSSLLALLVVSNIGFPWRMAATGALFALCLGALAASDARLGFRHRLGAQPLRWSPTIAKASLAAAAACVALAVFITERAATSEEKLVKAAKIAMSITASGRPNDPQFDELKGEMLRLAREGIAINPHYRKITPMIADELARWGDWRNATWIWESVLGSRPHIVAIISNAARGYASIGRNEKSLEYLERAKKLQPRAPAVRSFEVIMLGRGGQEGKALALAKQSMNDGVYDYDLVNTLFILSVRARDYPLAERAAALRMKEWPDSRARGHIQLGVMYAVELRQPEKGMESFRQGMALARGEERTQLLAMIPLEYRNQLTAAPSTGAGTQKP